MVKRTITILSGLPGAGKSVYSKTFSEDENTVIIEVDKFRTKDEGYSFSRLSELEVFRKVYRDIALLINNPSSECEHIIIDDVFPTEKSRGTIRALAYTYGWDVDVVYFAADADECYTHIERIV
jgi:predicted kinase